MVLGARSYWINGLGAPERGFEPVLERVAPDWRDHVGRRGSAELGPRRSGARAIPKTRYVLTSGTRWRVTYQGDAGGRAGEAWRPAGTRASCLALGCRGLTRDPATKKVSSQETRRRQLAGATIAFATLPPPRDTAWAMSRWWSTLEVVRGLLRCRWYSGYMGGAGCMVEVPRGQLYARYSSQVAEWSARRSRPLVGADVALIG